MNIGYKDQTIWPVYIIISNLDFKTKAVKFDQILNFGALSLLSISGRKIETKKIRI